MPRSTATKPTTRRRPRARAKIIIPAIIVILAIVAAVIIFIPKGPDHAISHAVDNQLQNSQVGKTTNQIIAPKKLISTMIVPSGAKWWTVLSHYVTQYRLDKISATNLGNPTSMGLVTFIDPDVASNQYLATPSVVLAYKTSADATTAQQKINALDTSATPYGAYKLGNNIMLLNKSLIAEQAFVLKNYHMSVDTAPVDKAYWHINWNNLQAYMSSVQNAEYRKTYAKILTYAGLVNTKAETYWDGYSTDGQNWSGENNNSTNKPIVDTAQLQPAQMLKYIQSTAVTVPIIDKNGDTVAYNIVDPKQSILIGSLGFSSKDFAVGSVTDPKTGKISEVKKTPNTSDITVTLDPNAFFQYMLQDTTSVWYLFSYRTVALKIDPSSNKMDIDFTNLYTFPAASTTP